jgi:hypothetical protein
VKITLELKTNPRISVDHVIQFTDKSRNQGKNFAPPGFELGPPLAQFPLMAAVNLLACCRLFPPWVSGLESAMMVPPGRDGTGARVRIPAVPISFFWPVRLMAAVNVTMCCPNFPIAHGCVLELMALMSELHFLVRSWEIGHTNALFLSTKRKAFAGIATFPVHETQSCCGN